VSSAFIITLEFFWNIYVLFIAALKRNFLAKSTIISPSTYSSFKAISSLRFPFKIKIILITIPNATPFNKSL
jgi:hypothetical protein